MTREEQAFEASKRFEESLTENDLATLSKDDMCFAFQLGVKWAYANPKSPWISTDKYLPKQGGHYLCNDGYNHISMLAFCGDKWVNSRTFDDIPLESVKYWMFLPKLPKEQEIKL